MGCAISSQEVTPVNSDGRLRLTAARVGARTVVTDVYRTAPFHPGPVQRRGERAEVVLQEVSPGIFPGDNLAIDVTVGDGAELTVLGQSATKIFPSPAAVPAVSTTSLVVAGAGSLWWLPGALIPFRDACYSARLTAVLEPDSQLALLEIITPGRQAMDERNAYRSLDLRVRIEVAGEPVLIERAVLDPEMRPPAWFQGQGERCCSGSLIGVGYRFPSQIEDSPEDVWLGAGGDCQLAVVRGIARSAETLRSALLGILRQAEAAGASRGWQGGLRDV